MGSVSPRVDPQRQKIHSTFRFAGGAAAAPASISACKNIASPRHPKTAPAFSRGPNSCTIWVHLKEHMATTMRAQNPLDSRTVFNTRQDYTKITSTQTRTYERKKIARYIRNLRTSNRQNISFDRLRSKMGWFLLFNQTQLHMSVPQAGLCFSPPKKEYCSC